MDQISQRFENEGLKIDREQPESIVKETEDTANS
jgi:hypothetical protein